MIKVEKIITSPKIRKKIVHSFTDRLIHEFYYYYCLFFISTEIHYCFEMIKKPLLFCFLFVLMIRLPAQDSGIRSITTGELKAHLEVLSSNELQGRRIGTSIPGLDRAAGYLASSAEKTGLQPGMKDYFQSFSLLMTGPGKENTRLQIRKNNELVLETDSVLIFTREKEILELTGELVFAGFGWKDSLSDYNDFKNLDIKNKILLVSTGTPASFREEMSGNPVRFDLSLERSKWKKMMQLGAKAIILINSPLDKNNGNYARIRSYRNRSSYSVAGGSEENMEDRIVFSVSSVFDRLTGHQGAMAKELRKRVEGHDRSEFPSRLVADIKVSSEIKRYQAKNVVGFIEGSDPELKNECVVFMAHYDHLGVDTNGEVFNGADDNGSGVVTLLEVAQAMTIQNKKPKRSIVFLWVTCEELGMLGSEYYCDHPLFPMDKTVACINLDMVGRVYEKRDDVLKNSPKLVKDYRGLFTLFGNTNPKIEKISDQACTQTGIEPDKTLPSQFLRSSDHYSFYSRGVPIINYATGYHADYHKISDEMDKINFKKMKMVAELCFLVGNELANREEIVRNSD